MTEPLDTCLVIDHAELTLEELPKIAATANSLGSSQLSLHLTRYPAFGETLGEAEIHSQSFPSVAHNIVKAAGRKVVPSAVDRELRLAAFEDTDNWLEEAAERLGAAATADGPAFADLASRMLGMAAWQDINFHDTEGPPASFATSQDRYQGLLDVMEWTTPERSIPDARRELEADPALRELALGSVTGLIIWEAEELIDMDLSFLEVLGRDVPTVGVSVEDAAMRRGFAETHPLLARLVGDRTELLKYSDVKRDDTAPSQCDGSPYKHRPETQLSDSTGEEVLIDMLEERPTR